MIPNIQRVQRATFYNLAAYYSLVTPLAMITSYVILCLIAHSNSDYAFLRDFLHHGILVLFSSVVAGIVGLFGIRHGAKGILWKSIIGIVVSCGIGLSFFVLWVAGMMSGG
jgi:hypothetical protein